VKALEPRVPPVPIFKVDPSVPDKVRLLVTTNVLEVVPPAIWNPVALAVKVKPFTEVGVIAPSPIVRAGVVVAVAQVAVTPLLAAAVETEVTVPFVGVDQVGAPDPAEVKTCPVVPAAVKA
jgi:hypothetical protein